MFGYATAPGAFGRTRAMARAVGLDLSGAVVEGWLSRAEMEALVSRCASCGRSGACDPFLATAPRGSPLPAFCANKPALDCLRAE